jgi:hypothetical protein
MQRLALSLGCALLVAGLSGCQSPWVQATIVNDQNTPVNLVEVNYPGGSFGIQSIAAHGNFHYRFHILLNDVITMDFTDAAGHNHTAKGPQLDQREAGTLLIAIEPDNMVVWTPALSHQK